MEVQASMNEHPDSSFPELFQTHYRQVVRQIMRITRDQVIAEDLAQEVFLRLYDQDRQTIENIGGWLTQASLYAAYNYLRSEKRRAVRGVAQQEEITALAPSTEEHWLKQDEIGSNP